jgi:hypothetical protein
MLFSLREAILVDARSKAIFVLVLLAANACASTPYSEKLAELRHLPEEQRLLVFRELDGEEKIALFFQANRRHPPYTGLNHALAGEGKDFIIRLRVELGEHGGVPDVLSFMSIALEMKSGGLLSREDVQALRIQGICQLAEQSEYCPRLAAKLSAH